MFFCNLCFLPADASERQHKIEAAYLYNFFNYITWPSYASPQALDVPIICIYGKDPILPYLEYIARKMAGERSLKIRIINRSDHETAGCHMLFMRHSMSYKMLKAATNDTLIVIKPDDPLDRGGMIELSEEDNDRIAISINHNQLEQKGFQVSSRLLDLARKMK